MTTKALNVIVDIAKERCEQTGHECDWECSLLSRSIVTVREALSATSGTARLASQEPAKVDRLINALVGRGEAQLAALERMKLQIDALIAAVSGLSVPEGNHSTDYRMGYADALDAARFTLGMPRPAAQDRASGPNTPDPYTGEGTAPTSPHEPAQAAIDTIARILVGTDWDDGVPCTDIGPRETVEALATEIVTRLGLAACDRCDGTGTVKEPDDH